MLIPSIKTIFSMALMTAWVLCISEFVSIKSALEFENFYINRFQMVQNQQAKKHYATQTHAWIQENKLHRTALDGDAHPSEIFVSPDRRDAPLRRIYVEKQVKVPRFVKGMLKSQPCGRAIRNPQAQIEDGYMVICAKSNAEGQDELFDAQ